VSEHDAVPDGLVQGLLDARAYPEDPSAPEGIELIQTHLSWVFLTPKRVYKLRKDVELDFVSFATRARRRRDCEREVALNRRLAPDVYLGVAGISVAGTRATVGPISDEFSPDSGESAHEPCVVMRRLEDERDALSLLQAGELRARQLDAVAESLARFHASARVSGSAPPQGWRPHVCGPVQDNFDALGEGQSVPAKTLERVARRTRAFETSHGDTLVRRMAEGSAVDGHGDLHLQHVWLERGAAGPVVIDCLEFSDELRLVDAANDIGFLAMDLWYRGRRRWAERLLRHYARESGDFGLYAVVDYYMAYRACVRAKVAAITARDTRVDSAQREGARTSARRHLTLADRILRPRPAPALFATCGAVGCGKSSVAEVFASELDAVVIASDRVRKQRAGLEARAHRPSALDQGMYTPAARADTYAALLRFAEPVLASGRSVVLDAAFGESQQRLELLQWGREHGVAPQLLELSCDPAVTLQRLQARSARGDDPSDAGPELLEPSLRRFEAPAEWPETSRFGVDTGKAQWRGEARRLAREIRGRIARSV